MLKDNQPTDLQRFSCTKCHFSAGSQDLVKSHFQIHNQIRRVNIDIINLTDLKCSYLSVEKEVEKNTSFNDLKITATSLKIKQVVIVLNGVQCHKYRTFATSHSLLESHKCIRTQLIETPSNGSKPKNNRRNESGNASKAKNETVEKNE